MRSLLVLLTLVPAVVVADEYVTDQPLPNEIGRFQIVKVQDVTLRLDSRTGVSWTLCTVKKTSKIGWCKVKDRGVLPAGPVGRYRMVDSASPTMMMMFDTVSGRAFNRCEDPTPEKQFSWCPIDD